MSKVEWITTLCNTDGISGREDKVRSALIEMIDGHCDWKVDARGNLLCHKKGRHPAVKKLMITAHMDEAGFMLTGIREDGLLSFANVGDVDSRVTLGKAVRIDGKTLGVIGTKPIHLQTKEEQDRPVPFDKLYIDIGASSKESAEQAVSLGAQITFAGEGVAEFGDGYLTGKAMETRAACAMLAEMLCEEWEYDVDVVFTTSAQTMTSGAANAAFVLRPDLALVIGSAKADDVRGGAHTCCLGKGPAVCLHDQTTYYDLTFYQQCLKAAKDHQIALQQIERSSDKNESKQIQTSCAGVPVMALSIPCRYPASISAMIAKQDLALTRQMILALAEEIQK